MAKSGQDESNSDTTRPGQAEAASGFREFRQAGRDAEFAARRLQAGTSEFLSSMMSRPYVDLMRETEGMTRQWTQGVRTSIEQAINIASKMNETAMNELRRNADLYLQVWEAGASLQRSMVREAENQANRQSGQARAQAAE
ncbi:MAG: hypothetical protein JO128_01980 [Alphaproteobacteria bacterium]|nr:hypothetical protein [Alphaproteobacteria bacterium]